MHTNTLDAAVAAAYGWSTDISDDEVLRELLAAQYHERLWFNVNIIWDGITQARTLTDEAAAARHALADAAKSGDWPRVLDLLSSHREWINSSRPGGSTWYAPLHQVAWHGAPVAVVRQLIGSGAWRTHQNAHGERPVDIAARRGHRHLLETLAPVHRHPVPLGILLKAQAHFHTVIRGRAEQLIDEHRLRLPELEPLLELDTPPPPPPQDVVRGTRHVRRVQLPIGGRGRPPQARFGKLVPGRRRVGPTPRNHAGRQPVGR